MKKTLLKILSYILVAVIASATTLLIISPQRQIMFYGGKLEQVRAEKELRRGAFQKRLLLLEVNED